MTTSHTLNWIRAHRRGIRSVGVPLVASFGLMSATGAETLADQFAALLESPELIALMVTLGPLLGLGEPKSEI